MSIHIGTAGYVYPHWRKGAFYPRGLSQSQELTHYLKNFVTVEINATWHAFPRRQTLRKWRVSAPSNALFALKVPKLITHQKRLRGVRQDILSFCSLAIDELKSNLGPILFQCPPSLPYSFEVLRDFVRDIEYVREQYPSSSFKVALELRDKAWFHPQVFQLLASNDIALVDNVVVFDHDSSLINHCSFPNARLVKDVPAASWRYVRFHGSKNPAVLTDFRHSILLPFAKRAASDPNISEFAFFLNDWGAFAPKNAVLYTQLVAKEKSLSVKELCHEFLPLWCKKPTSIKSFFKSKPASSGQVHANEQNVKKCHIPRVEKAQHRFLEPHRLSVSPQVVAQKDGQHSMMHRVSRNAAVKTSETTDSSILFQDGAHYHHMKTEQTPNSGQDNVAGEISEHEAVLRDSNVSESQCTPLHSDVMKRSLLLGNIIEQKSFTGALIPEMPSDSDNSVVAELEPPPQPVELMTSRESSFKMPGLKRSTELPSNPPRKALSVRKSGFRKSTTPKKKQRAKAARGVADIALFFRPASKER
ncbi:UPF0759 [Gracilaria domingensis]|nr:UPF0759 [Gracilaria domingensis]